MTTKHDAVIEALKATPPVGVVGVSAAGMSLQDWVLVLTAVYTVILIITKLPDLLRTLRKLFAGDTHDRID